MTVVYCDSEQCRIPMLEISLDCSVVTKQDSLDTMRCDHDTHVTASDKLICTSMGQMGQMRERGLFRDIEWHDFLTFIKTSYNFFTSCIITQNFTDCYCRSRLIIRLSEVILFPQYTDLLYFIFKQITKTYTPFQNNTRFMFQRTNASRD